MKHIFISGLNGFIGMHLANFFSSMNYEVYGLSRDLKLFLYSHKSGLSKKSINIEEISVDKGHSFFVNCCSKEFNNPELLNFYKINFLHSIKLANFCAENKINHFINLATTLDPESSLYANSKNLFSSQLNYLSNFLDLKSLNLFLEPVFGPGMKPPRLIPYIFESCARKETITINSSKNLLRHFIYIDDFLWAVDEVINSFNEFETDLYITGQRKYTIKEIVDEILKLTNSDINVHYVNANLLDYNFQTSNTVQSLESISSWRPKISLSAGLKKILKNELH